MSKYIGFTFYFKRIKLICFCLSGLVASWNFIGEIAAICRDRNAWRSQLKLLLRNPKRTSGKREIHRINSML